MNSHPVAAEADEKPSNIERKLDRVSAGSERMEQLLTRARRVLKPALTPEGIVAIASSKTGEAKASEQSPLAEQLDSLAYKLERQSNELSDLLDRFEA